MNDERDDYENAAIDPQLSAHYELIADESAPPELDRIVIRNARSALQSGRQADPFVGWLRPVAFVATAGLSLVIILNLSETGVITPPANTSPEVRPPATVQPMIAPSPESAKRNMTAAETADALRHEKSLAAVSSKLAAPASATDEDDLAATLRGNNPEAGALQRRNTQSDIAVDGAGGGAVSMQNTAVAGSAFDITTENTKNRLQDFEASLAPSSVAELNQSLPQTSPNLISGAVETPRQCSDGQRSGVQSWWQCVQTLRRAGMDQLAESEFESLQEEYPDFVASEQGRVPIPDTALRTAPE